MNYFLIESTNPNVRLRHYKNTRVANYTVNMLNATAGFDKYRIISEDSPVVTVFVGGCGFDVDPLAPSGTNLE